MAKCLLIIDVQIGFINDSTKHIPKLVEELQNKYEYIYITQFYNASNSFFRSLFNWNEFEKNSIEFALAFKPSERAVINTKSTYSCVTPHFINNIKKNKIKEVDLCGLDIELCVAKSAIDLFEIGI